MGRQLGVHEDLVMQYVTPLKRLGSLETVKNWFVFHRIRIFYKSSLSRSGDCDSGNWRGHP